jgi:hypothetical protein
MGAAGGGSCQRCVIVEAGIVRHFMQLTLNSKFAAAGVMTVISWAVELV